MDQHFTCNDSAGPVVTVDHITSIFPVTDEIMNYSLGMCTWCFAASDRIQCGISSDGCRFECIVHEVEQWSMLLFLAIL